ncbi:sensor histidine kinase [Nesterenkonia muleiensis]|uniref:sensor histidine kinase n=1 Tax=Nesterenkonia muleiensis TaxID=2282648 RepID=UPI000E73B355|nr:sensor histidine kinase [Nesterenkonia muleiensis]
MNVTAYRAEEPRRRLRRLARDYGYVLPGFPIAVFSFSLLLALTVASAATAVLWVGALLMPLTLVVASGFAELSRTRLRIWGAPVPAAAYRLAAPGLTGKLRILADPRRWLDLVFEMLITFPLRLGTVMVAVVWTVIGPAGLTYFFWSLFLPGERSLIQLLDLIDPGLVPAASSTQYLLDAGAYFVVGLVFMATLPAMMRGLAVLDATLTTALLGSADSAGAGAPLGPRPGPHSRDPSARVPDVGGPPPPRAEAAAIRHEEGIGGGRTASFSPAAWSWIGTGFAAAVLLAVGWPITSAVHSVPVVIAMVLVLAHCGSVVLTLHMTWTGLLLSMAAAGGLMVAVAEAGTLPWPWPVTALITQCAVLAVAALARPWYYAVSAWCGGAVLTLVALFIVDAERPSGSMANSIVSLSITAGVVVIGVLVRLWILNAGRLEAAERTSAEQDRRRKELQERNRIARELHDVVAHSMSVISVQAATAQYRNPGMDSSARREFEEIAGSSRQALSEMRMLLSILRGEDEVPTAPEPGLEDIDGLIQATRASGTLIRYSGLSTGGGSTQASSATGLAAYRIVQEALSNALRHAPAAEVDVDLSAESGERRRQLRITVANGPSPETMVDPAPGAGLGLSGIRERAAAVGGSVETGPTPAGGFTVDAVLPL